MGNSNSSEGEGGAPVGYFGVRVTGDAMKDVLAGEEKHITESMNRKILKAVGRTLNLPLFTLLTLFCTSLHLFSLYLLHSLLVLLSMKFEEAYEKGNSETKQKFAESFQAMGQETYMTYMNAIKEIHSQEYENSKSIIEPLENKLSVPAPDPHSRVCASEEKDLLKCMEGKSMVDCKSFSDHYSHCVQRSLKE